MTRRAMLTIGASALAVALAPPPPADASMSGRPRGRANFVSSCAYSHSAPDDPIVRPGEPGAAHLHDFFGNTTTDAGSTAESLRGRSTTCRRGLDTAAYWTPALYDGGRLVRPRTVAAYYQTAGKEPATIQPFPAGLRMVAGPGPGTAQWACSRRGRDSTTSATGPPDCREGDDLVVRVFFPDCWDGRNLDSADHHSHMAYNVGGTCPASHPVPVPRLRLGFHYRGTDGGGDVTLSSGGPDTAHADFFNAWDQAELERLVRDCLDAAVHCGGRGPDALPARPMRPRR